MGQTTASLSYKTWPTQLAPCCLRHSHVCATNRWSAHIPGDTQETLLSLQQPEEKQQLLSQPEPVSPHLWVHFLQMSTFRPDGLQKPQRTGKNRNTELLRTQENITHCHRFAPAITGLIRMLCKHKWSEIIKGTILPPLVHMEGTEGGRISTGGTGPWIPK